MMYIIIKVQLTAVGLTQAHRNNVHRRQSNVHVYMVTLYSVVSHTQCLRAYTYMKLVIQAISILVIID